MVANNEKALNSGTIKSKKALEKSARPTELNGRRQQNPRGTTPSDVYGENWKTHGQLAQNKPKIGKDVQSELLLENRNQSPREKSGKFSGIKGAPGNSQNQPRNLNQIPAVADQKKVKKSKERLNPRDAEILETKHQEEKSMGCKNESHGRGCKHENAGNNKINLCDEETKKILDAEYKLEGIKDFRLMVDELFGIANPIESIQKILGSIVESHFDSIYVEHNEEGSKFILIDRNAQSDVSRD